VDYRLAYLEEIKDQKVELNSDVILANGAYLADSDNFANIFDAEEKEKLFKVAMVASGGPPSVALKTYGGNVTFDVEGESGFPVTCSEADELKHLISGGALFQRSRLALLDGYITVDGEDFTIHCGEDDSGHTVTSRDCHPSEIPDSEVYTDIDTVTTCSDSCRDGSCVAYRYSAETRECELFGEGPLGWDQVSCYSQAAKKDKDFSTNLFYMVKSPKLSRNESVPAIGILPSTAPAPNQMKLMSTVEATHLQSLLKKTIVQHNLEGQALALSDASVT